MSLGWLCPNARTSRLSPCVLAVVLGSAASRENTFQHAVISARWSELVFVRVPKVCCKMQRGFGGPPPRCAAANNEQFFVSRQVFASLTGASAGFRLDTGRCVAANQKLILCVSTRTAPGVGWGPTRSRKSRTNSLCLVMERSTRKCSMCRIRMIYSMFWRGPLG